MLSLLKGAKEAKEAPADVDMAALMAKAGLDRLFPSNAWPNVAAVSLCGMCSQAPLQQHPQMRKLATTIERARKRNAGKSAGFVAVNLKE